MLLLLPGGTDRQDMWPLICVTNGWPGARSSEWRVWPSQARRTGRGLVASCPGFDPLKLVTSATNVAMITAIAKSTMAVPWLLRSLLIRNLHSNVETLLDLDGSPGANRWIDFLI